MAPKHIPMVALVGRPNVGKSSLFNRILRRNLAAVHDKAGTTRDRQYAQADWAGVAFWLIDTGGIESIERVEKGQAEPLAEDSASFIREIRAQAEMAIEEADVIVFVVDVRAGPIAADEEVAEVLRLAHKPVIVAANKADNPLQAQDAYDFYSLGLGQVFAVSGMHGTNVGDLLDSVVEALPYRPRADDDEDEIDESLNIAILGRPNVGKSSLLNRLLGEERVIVSPVAGTTRDTIDTSITYHGMPITLIDTAGIRRRGRVERGVERFSVIRALKAIERSSIALLLIDATEGPTLQDAHIAGAIIDAYKSAIVLVNKWDAVEEKDTYTTIHFEKQVRDALRFLAYVPILFISAMTGQRTNRILPTALQIHEERYFRLPTSEVNRIVQGALAAQSPLSKGGRRLKIRYASQVAVDPPKFLFHVNDVELVHFSYQRYLENQIREAHPFFGTPIQMRFKSTHDDDE